MLVVKTRSDCLWLWLAGKLEAALTKHDMVGAGAGFVVPAVYLSHLYQWTDKRQAATILQLAIGCEGLTGALAFGCVDVLVVALVLVAPGAGRASRWRR
eukprot:COSAG04_NODE_28_length_36566_cov_70.886665_29_plen_99_part_00